MPCKDVQRIRCEDLGYDWYEGSAISVDKDSKLDTRLPIKKKHDGNPIIGDSEGVCLFPNRDVWIGTPGGYVIDANKYAGQQRFMIQWSEYGYGWWEGDYKKMFGKSLQVSRQGKKPRKSTKKKKPTKSRKRKPRKSVKKKSQKRKPYK